MNRFDLKTAAIVMGLCLPLVSCDETGRGGENSTKGAYVISALVDNVNNLIQTDDLTKGEVSAALQGMETETGTAWVFYKDQYLYRLQYNQGNAGVTTSYEMGEDGFVTERSKTYSIRRFTTYGPVGANIVTVSAGDTDTKDADGNAAQGLLFNYLNVASETNRTGAINCENYLGNGEYITFAGFVETGGKIYTSCVPMGMSKYGVAYDNGSLVTYPEYIAKESGGQGSGQYEAGEIPTTQFPDNAYVAIFNGDDFSNPVIMKTDKIGFAAGRNRSQYYQTLWAADNGDVYVFSPGYGRAHKGTYNRTGTLRSGVVRIKSGATDFDASYYYDIETLSGGYAMFRCWHVTGDYFLLQMYDGNGTSKTDLSGIGYVGGSTTTLAIFKASTGTYTKVSGIPSTLSTFGSFPYFADGVAYVPVMTEDAQPAIYVIDPATAKAEKGLTVIAGSISAVGRLTAHN